MYKIILSITNHGNDYLRVFSQSTETFVEKQKMLWPIFNLQMLMGKRYRPQVRVCIQNHCALKYPINVKNARLQPIRMKILTTILQNQLLLEHNLFRAQH